MGLFDCMKCYPRLCRCQESHTETIGDRKAIQMLEHGMEPIGAMLLDPKTGRRATVDIYGRVQWWDVDGAGALVYCTELSGERSETAARLRDALRRIIAVAPGTVTTSHEMRRIATEALGHNAGDNPPQPRR